MCNKKMGMVELGTIFFISTVVMMASAVILNIDSSITGLAVGGGGYGASAAEEIAEEMPPVEEKPALLPKVEEKPVISKGALVKITGIFALVLAVTVILIVLLRGWVGGPREEERTLLDRELNEIVDEYLK